MSSQGLEINEKNGTFFLKGSLDEYADLSSIKMDPQLGELILNLSGLRRINSIGIRNLLKFLGPLGAVVVVYEECPSEFIDQVNMIPPLLGPNGKGKVLTLQVPFECIQCGNETEYMDQAENYVSFAHGGSAPERKCPKCGGKQNVVSESYFSFLNR